jgi:hypothetical protein
MYLKGGARNPLEYKKTRLEVFPLFLLRIYFVKADLFTSTKNIKSKTVVEKFDNN